MAALSDLQSESIWLGICNPRNILTCAALSDLQSERKWLGICNPRNIFFITFSFYGTKKQNRSGT